MLCSTCVRGATSAVQKIELQHGALILWSHTDVFKVKHSGFCFSAGLTAVKQTKKKENRSLPTIYFPSLFFICTWMIRTKKQKCPNFPEYVKSPEILASTDSKDKLDFLEFLLCFSRIKAQIKEGNKLFQHKDNNKKNLVCAQ